MSTPTTVSLDQSKNLRLKFRKGEGRSFKFTFLEDSAAFDISSYTFLFQVFEIDGTVAVFELEEADGLTNGGADGILTVDPTNTDVNIDSKTYNYKLKVTAPDKETWFNGEFVINDTPQDATDSDSATVDLDLGDNVVEVSITLAETLDDLTSAQVVTALGFTPADEADIVGLQDLYIGAVAMWPRDTSGCADLAKSEIATSLVNIQSLDFDQTTQEFCQFTIALPRNWDNGTVTARFYWTAAAGTPAETVRWGIKGGAYSNDDPLTTALGAEVTVDDTLIALNDLHISAESAAITLAGSPADADFLAFQISRNPDDDNLAADAKLLGILLTLTTDAATAA